MSQDQQLYRVFNDRVCQRRVVHRFFLGDVEDPQLYAGQALWEWQQSEQGQWVTRNAHDPFWITQQDYAQMGYRVVIQAWIEPRRWTEWCLRWPVV